MAVGEDVDVVGDPAGIEDLDDRGVHQAGGAVEADEGTDQGQGEAEGT